MKYLIIVLFFVSVNLYAQKCHYLVNKVSGMDDTRLVITEPLSLSENFGDGAVKVWSTIYGDTSLVVAFVIQMNEKYTLDKDDSILVRLENDDILGLVLFQNSVMKNEGKNNVITALTEIDKDAIEIFQKHEISEIIIDFGENKVSGSTDKKGESVALRTVINCVVRYLQ